MTEIAPFGYYVMTQEQHTDMMRSADMQERFDREARPTRWLYRASLPDAAIHMMRHYSQWFNDMLVWDIKENRIGAMLSNSYPLQYDPTAPEMTEEYLTFKERPEGRFRTVARRRYVYPHPSSSYQER